MNNNYHKLLCAVFFFALHQAGISQSPAFYHLTTANGLYDNHVRSVEIDRNGILWIGTEEGLNRYDGHSVSLFLKEKYPAIPSDMIRQLFSDTKDRLWVGTSEGAAWMNSRNQFYRVTVQDTILKFNVKAIIETEKSGVILITNKGQFAFDEVKKSWKVLKTIPDALKFENLRAVQANNGNEILFVTDSAVFIYNYDSNEIARQIPLTGAISVCKLQGDEIAIGKITGQIIIINTITTAITKQYFLNTNALNKANTPQPLQIKQASNGDLIIATGLNGLITINPTGLISRLVHNHNNTTSLVANSPYRIAIGSGGAVVIGTSTGGVSMYNTQLNQAEFTGFFTDLKGNYYDNYTSKIIEASNDSFWIGAYDRLINWDKKSNASRFYYYHIREGNETKRGNFLAMCLDKKDRLWVSIEGKGIAYFSKKSSRFIDLVTDTSLAAVFKTKSITDMVMDNDGIIWVCSGKGIFTLNPETKKLSLLSSYPPAKELSDKIVQSVYIDSKKRKWFATIYNGVYCYDKEGNILAHYTTKNGLPSDICYMVKEDKKGRFIITSSEGIAVIDTSGKVKSYNRQNGLRYTRCESVIIDDENIAWVSNKKCLVRLNIDSNQIEIFDERAGLLNDGFRVGSCLKSNSGILYWGGYRGISYFSPHQFKKTQIPLLVNVNSVFANDSALYLTNGYPLEIAYANNRVTFGFAAVHLGIPGKTYFQYRLQNFDKDWQKGEDINQAGYTALPSGKYNFELKASIDGVHWTTAKQIINISIIPPLWMRGWFISVSMVLFVAGFYWIILNRNKKSKQHKEDLEAEQVINYFAGSLHEQQTVDTILWDVARNCIGRLKFEDCVIYLLDEKKNALVQKAAYGPRSPKNAILTEPLEIHVGKDIPGNVALTGKAEIVGDRSKIAVPLIWGDKVIGVIDCEHPEKNYFSQKHLSVLNTIAGLCANKIVRARAEEEMKNAESILSNTRQKMAEVEMQALRAQMNPHFIFNCLNSINRYIVKSDQATASLYLTRFAKLIRLILDNSGNKNVSLSSELEALKLYIEMETLRFDNKFTYEIIVDKNVNTDSIELPPLIIQPYVENAIWHGLLHKDGGGQLTISIKLPDESMLECIIEDNGVGRAKAGELKSKSATSRKSLGMQLTESRLALLNHHASTNASITVIDLRNVQEQSAGTRVILLIPV